MDPLKLVIIAGLVVGAVIVLLLLQPSVRQRFTSNTLVYSTPAVLSETWHKFTIHNIESGSGRVLTDHSSNVTTSDAQGLTLLRAVWVDDKATFDAGWRWTKTYGLNTNGLPAASYGPRNSTGYGIIDQSSHAAADIHTALALLMAYKRWGNEADLQDAKNIIAAISAHETVSADGKPLIIASDTYAVSGTQATVDTRTLNPAAFREFAKVDLSYDWTGLVATTYRLLPDVISQANGAVPDQVTVDTTTGDVTVDDASFGQAGAEAVFNLGLDNAWYHDGRDKTVLASIHKPATISGASSHAFDAKLLSYDDVTGSKDDSATYHIELLNLYDQDKQEWRTSLSFDDDTWVWLGIGLHQNGLRHLTE